MKNKTPPPEATKTEYPILRQIVNLIPPNIFHAAASATKDLSLVFTPWSHAVALIYQQITKTESLNGVCDAARVHASQRQKLRGAVPPKRNTFSNANQNRDPAMMETLYWMMKDYLGGLYPDFIKIKDFGGVCPQIAAGQIAAGLSPHSIRPTRPSCPSRPTIPHSAP